MTVKQRGSKMLLERAHLVAHRAVGEMELVGGLGEALQPRRGLERPQRGQGWETLGHM